MWKVLQLWSCISIAGVVSVPDKLFGHRGQTFDIKCRYKSGYESNVKYFCKGKCKNRNVIVKSGSPAKDGRFSLTDDTTNRVFTVTITDLRTEDEGQYWCVVEKKFNVDVYSEILLQLKQASTTLETPLPQTSTPDSGSIVVIISAGVLVLLLISVVMVIVIIRKKKQTCGLVCSSTEGLDLTLRNGEENEYERMNPTVQLNSHTTADVFHRHAVTDLCHINASPDQIYTELNASRQSNLYQSLAADYANQQSI